MTGARFPSAFGRGQAGPLQVSIPSRLPGGLWGTPPARGTLVFDANGFPSSAGTVTGPFSAGALAQTEWPIPTRWEVQLGVNIEPLAGTSTPWNQLANTDVFLVNWEITASIESAEFTLRYPAARVGPGLYPLAFNLQNFGDNPTGGATLVLMGQTIRARIADFVVQPDGNLANTSWSWSATALIGLTSSGWPSP